MLPRLYKFGQKNCKLKKIFSPLKGSLSKKYLSTSPYFQVNASLSPTLEFRDTAKNSPAPIFRVLDEEGVPIKGKNFEMPVDEDTAIELYKTMILGSVFDDIFYKLTRIGKTSFYMQNTGEEAAQVGSAAAWKPEDVIYFQYRELGVFLQRGFTIQQCSDQIYCNTRGHGKGRQMPVHYGCRELNCVTISSPLATQMPQASGTGYGLKREKKGACCICYFGDGAASEGDAHAAFNFSATTESPVIWFCRNNAYAISTPTKDQYRGDGIAARASGYGMYVARFDGNDIFAVYEASKLARELCVKESRPILLEALTYRGSHHSTSDDKATYRGKEEDDRFLKHSPIKRLKLFLTKQSLWDEKKEIAYREECTEKVNNAYKNSETLLKPHWSNLFTDVFDELPANLQEQQKELEEHLKRWKDIYSKEISEDHQDIYKLHTHSPTP